MAAHSSLSGADLHEPKGIESASAGTVYKSNGAGSGSWGKIGTGNLDTSTILSTNKFYLCHQVTVSSATDLWIQVPTKCQLVAVRWACNGSFTTTDLAVNVYSAGTNIGTGTQTAAGSAAGVGGGFFALTNNLAAGSSIRITTAAVTGTVVAHFSLEFLMVP